MGRLGKVVGGPILHLAVPRATLALALATATPHDLAGQGTWEVERRVVSDTTIVRTMSGSVSPADLTLEHLGLDGLWGTARGEYGEVYVVRLGSGPFPA